MGINRWPICNGLKTMDTPQLELELTDDDELTQYVLLFNAWLPQIFTLPTFVLWSLRH